MTTGAAYEQAYQQRCAACGHRALLHGAQGASAQAIWCLMWDGERFCGCTIAPVAAEPVAAQKSDKLLGFLGADTV